MKLRKHKNNKTFLITFTSRSPRSRGRSETHLSADGRKTRRVIIEGKDGEVSQGRRVWATGSCKQSVLRAFLTGRDVHNITAFIREAKPLSAQFNGVLTTIAI